MAKLCKDLRSELAVAREALEKIKTMSPACVRSPRLVAREALAKIDEGKL